MIAPTATPSAAQLHAWRRLWALLLAPPATQPDADGTATPAGEQRHPTPPTGAQCDDLRDGTREPLQHGV